MKSNPISVTTPVILSASPNGLIRPKFSMAASIHSGRNAILSLLLPTILAGTALADTGTWIGTDGVWASNANWNGASFPGATSGTTSTDVATFTTLGVQQNITLPSYINIQDLVNAGSTLREIKSGTLSFTSGGSVTAQTAYMNIYSTMQLNGTGITVNSIAGIGMIGNVIGTGGIEYRGTGAVQIDGLSTYTGATKFLGTKTALVSKIANGGSASALGASSSDAANLVFGAGSSISYTGMATGETDRNFTANGNFTIYFGNAANNGSLRFTSHEAVAFGTPNTALQFTVHGKGKGDNLFGLSLGDNGTGKVNVQKWDVAKVIFSGNNSYTGVTSIGGGILNIQSNNALGATLDGLATAGTSVDAGATLQIEGGITVGNERLTIKGAGAAAAANGQAKQNGALVNVSGNNTWGGAIILGAASTISSDTGNLAITGTVGGGYDLTLTGAGNGSFSNVIGTGAGKVIKNGTGTWKLSGANTNTGGVAVNEGKLLVNNTTGSGVGTGSLTVATTGTLGGTGIITPGAGKSISVDGVLAVGDDAVNGGIGTLTIDASTTNVAVANFSATAVFSFDLNATLNMSDTLALLSGSLGDFVFHDNTINFSVTGDLVDGQTYKLFDGTNSNQFSGLTLDMDNRITAGLTFTGIADNYKDSYLSLRDGDIFLNIVDAIPEPSTWVLILAGAFSVGIIGNRRRRLSGIGR